MSSVLIVEDNEALREMFRDALASRGHKVSVAGTLSDGLRLARVDHLDLALLDLGLPDERGLRTLLRWRAEFPNTVAVVVTGDVTLGREATLLGAMDYIEKPVEVSELAGRVERALERTRIWVYRPIKEKLDKLIADMEARPEVPGTEVETDKLPEPPASRLGRTRVPAVVVCVLTAVAGVAWLGYSARSARPVSVEPGVRPDPIDPIALFL